MSGHDDFDRVLADWFAVDAEPAIPEGGLDRLVDATRKRRPRPTPFAAVGSHWARPSIDWNTTPDASTGSRLDTRWSMALLALLLVAALVAGALVVGTRWLDPKPTSRHLGHLAYGLESNLFIADWNGADPVPVTDAWPSGSAPCRDGGHDDPAWSPDGRYLAYRAGRCDLDSGIVFVVDPTGRPVTSFPGHGWDIAWSPDSTRIATWISPDLTIGVYGLDGKLQARVALPAGYGAYRDEDAHWSPDDDSLLVSLRPDGVVGQRRTWELPITGGMPRALPASDPRSFENATYSADGQTVAYAKGSESAVVVAAADGTHRRVLRHDGILVSGPLLSPMGDRVVVALDTGVAPSAGASTGSELVIIDVATGSSRSLVGAGGTASLAPTQFSPEGDRLLYSSDDGMGNGPVSTWSIDVAGSRPPVLVVSDGGGHWQWLPPGS